MVVAAAREKHYGEIAFTGMRLPLIAFALAKATHAPRAIGLFENGLVRDTPATELLYTMGDPPNITGAQWATRMTNIMGLLAQGWVDLGFVGGAEVDRFGNLNTSYVDPSQNRGAKLPGSGGGADIASLAKRLVVIMPHEKRRLVERVSFVTSPGYGDGPGWRQRVGLVRGGTRALITTRAVFYFDRETCEAVLHSFHHGETIESVRDDTGWSLQVAPDARETVAPTVEELKIIRRYDPQGFWTGRR